MVGGILISVFLLARSTKAVCSVKSVETVNPPCLWSVNCSAMLEGTGIVFMVFNSNADREINICRDPIVTSYKRNKRRMNGAVHIDSTRVKGAHSYLEVKM